MWLSHWETEQDFEEMIASVDNVSLSLPYGAPSGNILNGILRGVSSAF